MNGKDSQGFYRRLGVSPSASQAEIKAAHRAKAKALHPDINSDKRAAADFQALQAAYTVLSNEKSRKKYDAEHETAPKRTERRDPARRPFGPVVCSRCNALSAQPRYKAFHTVYAYLIGAQQDEHQGVFCSKCETWAALQCSLITLVAGWWSPSGFVWTVRALSKNIVGGTFHAANAELHASQAKYFAQKGNHSLARAVAIQALQHADRAQKEGKTAAIRLLRISLEQFLASLPPNTAILELKNTDMVVNMRFFLQLGLLTAFCSVLYLGLRVEFAEPTNRGRAGLQQSTRPAITKPLTPP